MVCQLCVPPSNSVLMSLVDKEFLFPPFICSSSYRRKDRKDFIYIERSLSSFGISGVYGNRWIDVSV